ncbi:hypothetical protein FLAN108750_03070 [Flavobacterium antarcticum]|uniref:hypothetical protein n=1 Tax=Flavobacterium antarcticum TaxID=271155 RepID=UPI0003B46B29|nr:hypothetical protein [Flavobacterium antarcticum]
MKKFFSLALGLILLASCSSDDSSNSIDTSKLTNKKWIPVSTEVFGMTIPYEHENIQCGKDYEMFETGGVLKTVYYDFDCSEDIYLETWKLEGNKITTIEDGVIIVGTIVKLDATSLVVSAEVDVNEDGKDETLELTYSSN